MTPATHHLSYREALYARYLSAHFSQIRDFRPASLACSHRVFRHHFARFLPARRDARILEIGCGYGAFLDYLQRQGYRAEGIDISPEQIQMAGELGVGNVSCADAFSFLPERGQLYDCIVGIDILEHFSKPEAFQLLENIYRALRPGGTVLLQTVNGGGPLAGRLRYADYTHELALTPSSARQLLRAAGFTGIQVCGTDPFIHGLASFTRVLVWNIIKAFLWIYVAAETGSTRDQLFTQNLIMFAARPRA